MTIQTPHLPSPAPTDTAVSQNCGGRKGKTTGPHVTEHDETELFRICKKHEACYGNRGEKKGMVYFWNLVARDFGEYHDGKPYSAKSCRRKVADKIAKRRAELELNEIGREEIEDDWTIALDAWREVLDFYEAREDEKKVKSEKARKESEKANRFRDNLCKRKGRKRAIDSSESSSDSEGSDTGLHEGRNSRNGSRERTSFSNHTPDFEELPIPHDGPEITQRYNRKRARNTLEPEKTR